MNWTPQCPKAEASGGPEETRLLLVWTQLQLVLKPGRQRGRNPRVPEAKAPVGPEETGLL